MSKAIRIQKPGGPEVLSWDTSDVGDPGPGEAADFLQPLATLAEHDGALGIAFHQDLLMDGDAAVAPFFPFFGFYRAGIGQFGVELVI